MLIEQTKCQQIADCLDSLRIIPRFLILAGYIFYGYMFVWISDWFMSYEWNSLTNQAVALSMAAFPTGILGVLGAVLGSLTKHEMSARYSDVRT